MQIYPKKGKEKFASLLFAIPTAVLVGHKAGAFAPRMTQGSSNSWGYVMRRVRLGGGGACTLFGEDVVSFVNNGVNMDWENVCELDSDEHGSTNGAGLGDSDCMWRLGDPQVNFEATDPSDLAEFLQSEMSMAGEEALIGGMEMPAAGEDVSAASEEMDEENNGGQSRGCQAGRASRNSKRHLSLIFGLIALCFWRRRDAALSF